MRTSDATAVGFSVTWIAFALTWAWQAFRQGAPAWYAALAAPFLLVGVYLLTLRYLVDARLRRHMVYAITDRRVVVLYAGRKMYERSLPLARIAAIHLKKHRDGTGSLLFVPLPEAPEIPGEAPPQALPGAPPEAQPAFRLPAARRQPLAVLRFEFLAHPQAILDEIEEARRLASQAVASA